MACLRLILLLVVMSVKPKHLLGYIMYREALHKGTLLLASQ